MTARLFALVLTLTLTTAVLAQQDPAGDVDLRPEGMQFDNVGIEDLPIGVTPETPGVAPWDEALEISDDIFGPPNKADEAYGAFQRGYFLTALALALPRAERGDPAAQTLIAEIYAKGLGVAQNLPTASGWYALASKNGDRLATFELALMYQDGQGVPKSRQRAAELFQKAADQGSIPGKYNLGLLYVEGLYVEPNLVKAAALIKEAADAGMPEAQYDYGNMLIEGAGAAPNPTEGVKWIGMAARQGLVEAQVDYATMLYLGENVTRDRVAATTWYARAAGAGNAVAQNRYAKLLAAGEGVGVDLESAAMWRALARRQGLNDPQLDKMLVSIPTDELARAEERARYWPGSPPTSVAQADVPQASGPTQTP
jgi:TPR repeat protein